MKFSIITVAYNSAATIVDALKSVAEQTHPDIEHIVIDGGSTDDTVALVRRHARQPLILVSEPDQGIYDAMNKGLRLATGDFVGLLNADDFLSTPQAIARLDQAARADAADLVYADLVYVQAGATHKIIRRWRSGAFKPARLRYGWMPPHPTLYVRRSLIESLGGFDTDLRIAADYDFMLRLLTRPGVKTSYVPEVLVRMRLGGASNASLKAVLKKSLEDLTVMRRYNVGGWLTLACKNFRKLPQFV